MTTTSGDLKDQLAAKPLQDRLAAMIDRWKRRLLDLTRRNRALNFKPTRVSTVAVVGEQPAAIFRRLFLQELPMKFRAQPAGPAASGVAVDEELDVEDIPGAGVDFVPYESPPPGEPRHDDWLQTASTPEALDMSLRRIDEITRSTLQEQGVNTLYLTLGMLYFKESPETSELVKAPLVMLPVTLTRKSARAGFVVQAGEDEPIANPALVELLRRNHGINLAELPRSDRYPDDYDLQDYLADVAARIRDEQDWAVKNDVFLASFSFQKLVMYRDLETNLSAAMQHRLVQQLATGEGSENIGLPADIRALDLDTAFPPEGTHQIVDADSSQLRAIAAVARQHDLVIEGPPGTGKSQTITNLIATSLAAGKSVLFVAEKQAALAVVHRRLVAAGLGEFCLELHSNKASKRAVMQQIGDALDASLQGTAHSDAAALRLPQVRAELTAYAKAVHAPFGALGWSPYQVYGEFARLLDALRRPYHGPVDTVTAAELDETVRQLEALATAVTGVGRPELHPWRDATKPSYLPTKLEEIGDAGQALVPRLETLRETAWAVGTNLGFPRVTTFAEIAHAREAASVFARSPGVPREVLTDAAWDEPPPEALALVRQGRELRALREQVSALFTDQALEQEHAVDIAFMEEMLGRDFTFLAFFNSRFRAVRRRWLDCRRAGYERSLVDQATDLKLVDRLHRERAALETAGAARRTLFGQHWRGEATNWDVLDRYISWVGEFRQTCRCFHLDVERAAGLASPPAPAFPPVAELDRLAATVARELAAFTAAVGWPENYLVAAPFREIQARLAALLAALDAGPAWAAYEAARRAAAAGLAAEFVQAAQAGEMAFADLSRGFRRAWFAKWLAACMRQRPLLEHFHTLSHDELVAEFRRLDERVLLDNRARLVGQLRDAVQAKLKRPDAAAGMPVLRRELARQRGLQPLRLTLREAEAAIRAIKPCFMMSPLTVAQFLEGGHPTFDVVIFDEASQLPSEDAAGAIIRGRQLVVVGDPKQLPPTAFFAGSQTPAFSEDGTPLVPDAESVLEEYMGAGMPMSRLKWHYRSAHESLINFSNVSFYDSDLCTFPSVETGDAHGGLQFEFVPGVYEGKGLNPVEARRVAEAVAEFARVQAARRARGEPGQSLGVGTFNLRQQLAIMDELESLRRTDPALEPFFDLGGAEPFFVKNLENIQGDERDVIFISVTYARGPDGRLRHNFGPLNGENGWRRLNVLVTRARQCMRVFSSMRSEEINPAATADVGAKLLRSFLAYAERGQLERAAKTAGAGPGHPLEQDVAAELARRGITLVPRIGVAGYPIDLGVTDEAVPGRFICGIECDGAAYHAAETARDRDRLRPQVLEARGWIIHRLWSTSWFFDRKGEIERLCRLIHRSKQRLVRDREAVEQAAELARQPAEDGARAPETGGPDAVPYQRMQAEPYVVTPFDAAADRGDLLTVPLERIVAAVVAVTETEGPVHLEEVCLRVAQMWATKVGAKTSRRSERAIEAAESQGGIARRGDFCWRPDGQCRLRSRAVTRTPADRIAPEEYEGIIRRILGDGHGFAREELVAEVRSILGFSRTGAAFDEAVRRVIDRMLETEQVGEGSTGIKLRVTPPREATRDLSPVASEESVAG